MIARLAWSLAAVLFLAVNPLRGAFVEDFETFDLGPVHLQNLWFSDSADAMVTESGIPGFGERSVVYAPTQPEFLFMRTPNFTMPYGEGVFADVIVTDDSHPFFSLQIKPWDLGGGIQNTIIDLREDGSVAAFQLNSSVAGGLGEWRSTSGSWTRNKKTRLGVVVRASGSPEPGLTVYQDGNIIFEGHDMAQANPFGGPDTGINQLRFESNSGFVIDNLSDSMFASANPDLDNNGLLDISDIDALITAISAGSTDSTFDISGDGAVDISDRDAWLSVAGAANLPNGQSYLLADANLDGFVDGQDFINWNNHKFSASGTWSQADFDADGFTDGNDFVIWNETKFTSSDGVTSVPEPHSLNILALTFLLFGRRSAT